jgi:hypothetical protein
MSFQVLQDTPVRTFERLLRRVRLIMKRFGRPYSRESGDFWLLEEHLWRSGQILVNFMNLELLHPRVIRTLQKQLRAFPGWEIVIVIDVIDHPEWPQMGLRVREHEIVDDLVRDWFPPQFRHFRYDEPAELRNCAP